MIEIIHEHVERGAARIRFAVFDMDGTLSLIREGWPRVMQDSMLAELLPTPQRESESDLARFVADLVASTNGQTTSYQMSRLADEIHARGGQAEEPNVYKQRYLARLGERIDRRVADLRSGHIAPDDLMVAGAREMLEAMRAHGVRCYLVSGTYEPFVFEEADALDIAGYFAGIYGGQDDPARFSKRMFMQNLMDSYLLDGHEVVSLGDGIAEIKEAKQVGALTVGVASNEAARAGLDEAKRTRLIEAGADIIVPDFGEHAALAAHLFNA
jgi:phosphoglycolate phosphatase-like HAD superfamily hydrolase